MTIQEPQSLWGPLAFACVPLLFAAGCPSKTGGQDAASVAGIPLIIEADPSICPTGIPFTDDQCLHVAATSAGSLVWEGWPICGASLCTGAITLPMGGAPRLVETCLGPTVDALSLCVPGYEPLSVAVTADPLPEPHVLRSEACPNQGFDLRFTFRGLTVRYPFVPAAAGADAGAGCPPRPSPGTTAADASASPCPCPSGAS